ncbi:hypothetical protein SUGI_0954080 [Cryptomeria japonica]|nr:hypothetical protein SUGI_0954080 [Cryptomeria japonica]
MFRVFGSSKAIFLHKNRHHRGKRTTSLAKTSIVLEQGAVNMSSFCFSNSWQQKMRSVTLFPSNRQSWYHPR